MSLSKPGSYCFSRTLLRPNSLLPSLVNKRVAVTGSIACILLLAIALRLWGAWFGLPYAYHVDEQAYVSTALNLGAGIIGRQPDPTGFSNVLFSEYTLYYLAGRLAGLFPSLSSFEQAFRSDPSMFLLLGRLTSIFFGTLNVLTVYWIGRDSRGRWVGLLAGLFVGTAFLLVRDSHYAVPDITMTFFVSLCVSLILIAIKRADHRLFYLAAAAGGFAIATKWTALPILIPLGLAILQSRAQGHVVAARGWYKPRILVSCLFVIVGLLIGGWQLLVNPIAYFGKALDESRRAGSTGGFDQWLVDTLPGWFFYIKTLIWGVGIPILVLSAMGCMGHFIRVLRKLDINSLILLSFPLTYYILMGATGHYFARYALPLIPFLVIFAADATGTIVAWAKKRHNGLGWGLALSLTVIIIAQPLVSSARYDSLLTNTDTRTLAQEWIDNNIPAGAKMAVDWRTYGPPLSTAENKVPGSSQIYEVTIINGAGLSEHPITWYRQQGFQYLIASSFIYNIPLVNEKDDQDRKVFYASLDHELWLVQEIRPHNESSEPPFIFDEIYGPAISLWQRVRPGPTLRIYEVPQ